MTPETLPAPVETVTPIKPSEAIRLGCLLAPVPWDSQLFGPDGEACVLGAMGLGFGWHKDDVTYTRLEDVLPSLPYPGEYEDAPNSPDEILYVLNDQDGWSRERIADWLEGLGL